MKHIKKMDLIRKITLIIILILIVPITIVCIFYYRVIEKSLLTDANNGLSESLSKMELKMNANLDEIETVINEMIYRQEFSYFLDANQNLSEKEMNYFVTNVQNEMINIKYLYPNQFNSIIIYSSNSQINSKSYEWKFDFQTFKQKTYYNELIKEKDNLVFGEIREKDAVATNLNTKNLTIGNSEVYVLPTYYKIYNLSTKQIIGIIEIDMPIKKLVGYDDEIEKNSQTKFLLLNKDGTILTGSKDLMNEKLDKIKVSEIKEKKIIQIGNVNYYGKYSVCERTGLIRLVLYNVDQISKFNSDMIVKVVLVAILGFTAVVIIIYFFIRSMLKRLVILDEMMVRIEGGEFAVFIPDDGYEDEVNRISRTFNRMSAHLREVIEKVIQNEKAQQDAEFRALQAQINPHFLYNTLENMRMQCEIEGFFVLGDSLSALGDLFRYSIQWGTKSVPFELEWNNMKNYLSIMQMRNEEDLECDLECQEGVESIIVPKLILQPLIENSFNHGFRETLPPWKLSVRAYQEDNYLKICIKDNGCGISEERLKRIEECMREQKPFREKEKVKNSIGVFNVQRRIQMLHGEESGICLVSELGKGTTIIISILIGGNNGV